MELPPDFPHAIVTCGPAIAPLDNVRRITNFSTGELGVRLAETLLEKGWRVTCLKGSGATFRTPSGPRLTVRFFDTNEDLLSGLREIQEPQHVNFVFHAAALSDFEVAEIFGRDGEAIEAKKISSSCPEVHLVLKPATKVLPQLKTLFPKAKVVGWKFELEGDRATALASAQAQLERNQSALCIVNGMAYGDGFGVATSAGLSHNMQTKSELCLWLADWAADTIHLSETTAPQS